MFRLFDGFLMAPQHYQALGAIQANALFGT
jgi:hypothetical protein